MVSCHTKMGNFCASRYVCSFSDHFLTKSEIILYVVFYLYNWRFILLLVDWHEVWGQILTSDLLFCAAQNLVDLARWEFFQYGKFLSDISSSLWHRDHGWSPLVIPSSWNFHGNWASFRVPLRLLWIISDPWQAWELRNWKVAFTFFPSPPSKWVECTLAAT